MAGKTRLGIIGGSGLYALDDMQNVEIRETETPWGKPASQLISGEMDGVEVLFLSRHGEGHRIPPSDINYRANIAALKMAGATDILSVSACGSFKEDLPPGYFVIVDQYIDRTRNRAGSFFETGLVAHVSMAEPVCPRLAGILAEGCAALSIPHQQGGTYLAMEGPQFSSKAESLLYKSWGCDVIGMTNMPEAKLAREAELPYASVCMITDYDCWRDHGEHVEVANIMTIMQENSRRARLLVRDVVNRLGPEREVCPAGTESCLDFAIVTAPEARDRAVVEKLKAIAGRVL